MDDRLIVINPTTGDQVAAVVDAGQEGVDRAAGRATAAGTAWERTPAADRAAALDRGAAAIEAHADAIARLQVQEMGKRLADALGGVGAGVGAIRQYAQLGPLHRGKTLHGAHDALDLMIPTPIGTVAVIVPWNDPVAIACQGVAAALAVGNTVLVKPSERAPLAVARALELLAAELPEDVCQIVQGGRATGAALVEHPVVGAVLHTGSVETGRWIAERCGALLKRAVLELGGKDPFVVDEGVDIDWAADQAAVAAFAGAGQICVSAERFYVHQAIAEPFTEALALRAKSLVLGDPSDEATELGPLVDRRQVEWVDGHVRAAVGGGAVAVTGGAPLPGPGCFYPATVLTGVTREMAVMRTETFGPVAPIAVVADFDEALARANDSVYGLAGVVLTGSMRHAQRAIRELRVGTVKINAAFGGAPGGAASPHGTSGLGFGYGPELLDELVRVRVAHLEPAPTSDGEAR